MGLNMKTITSIEGQEFTKSEKDEVVLTASEPVYMTDRNRYKIAINADGVRYMYCNHDREDAYYVLEADKIDEILKRFEND
jgi:hypothetical protein